MKIGHVASPLSSANPAASAVGDAAVVGVATAAAHADHKHPREAFATPAVVLAAAAAAGAATTLMRSDATIAAFDATSPSTQAFGDAAAVGAAAFAARRDHKHAMMASPHIEGKITAGGVAESVTWTASYGGTPACSVTAVGSTGSNNDGAWLTAVSTSGATAYSFTNAVQNSQVKHFMACPTT